jgi:hypothetical protein
MDDLINIAPLQTLDFFRRVLRFGYNPQAFPFANRMTLLDPFIAERAPVCVPDLSVAQC